MTNGKYVPILPAHFIQDYTEVVKMANGYTKYDSRYIPKCMDASKLIKELKRYPGNYPVIMVHSSVTADTTKITRVRRGENEEGVYILLE